MSPADRAGAASRGLRMFQDWPVSFRRLLDEIQPVCRGSPVSDRIPNGTLAAWLRRLVGPAWEPVRQEVIAHMARSQQGGSPRRAVRVVGRRPGEQCQGGLAEHPQAKPCASLHATLGFAGRARRGPAMVGSRGDVLAMAEWRADHVTRDRLLVELGISLHLLGELDRGAILRQLWQALEVGPVPSLVRRSNLSWPPFQEGRRSLSWHPPVTAAVSRRPLVAWAPTWPLSEQ